MAELSMDNFGRAISILLEIKLINSDARRGCSSNTHNQKASVLFLALLLIQPENTNQILITFVIIDQLKDGFLGDVAKLNQGCGINIVTKLTTSKFPLNLSVLLRSIVRKSPERLMQVETSSRANLQKITTKFFHNVDVKGEASKTGHLNNFVGNPNTKKLFRQKLYGFKGDILWCHQFNLEEQPEGHVKVSSNFINGIPYMLLHILVAHLKSFPKHYNYILPVINIQLLLLFERVNFLSPVNNITQQSSVLQAYENKNPRNSPAFHRTLQFSQCIHSQCIQCTPDIQSEKQNSGSYNKQSFVFVKIVTSGQFGSSIKKSTRNKFDSVAKKSTAGLIIVDRASKGYKDRMLRLHITDFLEVKYVRECKSVKWTVKATTE
ncbi:hypothetical protein EAG_02247 [Camponotus floridanus]|uniref:Uncharacterized protein n=1 Tax=Camponotus floridanus TaxID=104421 RepID=E2B0L6_CAMFO|nr:hypothetical protein EAG_02247 [Camponotus floridanus]